MLCNLDQSWKPHSQPAACLHAFLNDWIHALMFANPSMHSKLLYRDGWHPPTIPFFKLNLDGSRDWRCSRILLEGSFEILMVIGKVVLWDALVLALFWMPKLVLC